MNKFFQAILILFGFHSSINGQVQVQANYESSEFGLNTFIEKSIGLNNKLNYFNYTNFDISLESDSVGNSEFFHVIDYNLFNNFGLALGNSINKNNFIPEFGLSYNYENDDFNFNLYPTINYLFKSKQIGFGFNGVASYSPKINKNWSLFNLLILNLDFDGESDYNGNQTLLTGLGYKEKIDFGVSLNLSTEDNEFETQVGVFMGLKIFGFAEDEKSYKSNVNNDASLSHIGMSFTMPEESEPHEGTWLQWPHSYQYGTKYQNSLDPTWVAMTRALATSENVHIIAYDQEQKRRIIAMLNKENIPLTNIDFSIYKTDDVWVRDNGPIFANDKDGNLVIQDWGFNAWGQKKDDQSGYTIGFENCNLIPTKISADQAKAVIDLNSIMINEGGSIEIDGHGTLMACKSSILNDNRNPGMTQTQAEAIFTKYLGVTNFIWLDGQPGLELTDQHIDGFARFGNANTIVTMDNSDLLDFSVLQSDINKLYSAKNKNGKPYTFVKVPLTRHNVVTTDGTDLGYKGSYVNYYIANNKVLVPNYNDPNDNIANQIIQSLYPNRKVVGIDVRNLYANGGMIHCVTQQQPK